MQGLEKRSLTMTTDAKIGLLLALVFIVAITFVINGLPDFLNKKQPDVTSKYVGHYTKRDDPGIIGHSTQEVAAALNHNKIVSSPAPVAEVNTVQNGTYTAATEAVKSTQPAQAPEQAAQTGKTVSKAVVETKPAAAPVSETPAAVENKNQPQVVKNESTTYQVTQGDNLVNIAQKVYGPQAGSRHANVEKIYEANKKTMKSPDQLHVGQKIVIPKLSEKEKVLLKTEMFEKPDGPPSASLTGLKATDNVPQKENVLSKEEVKKKESVPQKENVLSKEAVQKKESLPQKETKNYREYTVKEQDTIWKIAAKTLGNGNRFSEISQLNPSVNPDKLTVGTKLKLPAK